MGVYVCEEAEELNILIKKNEIHQVHEFTPLASQDYLDWHLARTAHEAQWEKQNSSLQYGLFMVTEKLQGNCQLASVLFLTLCINIPNVAPPRKRMANSKNFSHFKLLLMKWAL